MHSLAKLCLLACVRNKTVQLLLIMDGHYIGLALGSHNDAVTSSTGTARQPPPLSMQIIAETSSFGCRRHMRMELSLCSKASLEIACLLFSLVRLLQDIERQGTWAQEQR